MASSIRRLCIVGTAIVAIAGTAPVAARETEAAINRKLSTAHQPTVSRSDYVFDAVIGPQGLAPGEDQRLAGWFDGLSLGYADTVTLADPGGWRGDPAAQAVGAVLARYGMLLADQGAPVTAGRPPASSVRIIVSRAAAHVAGCPDWSTGNGSDYARHTTSDYGCAAALNLAAMIADPQDLVAGVTATPAMDSRISVKAIKSYRDAKNTGDAGLPGGITSMSVSKGGGS